MFAEKVYTDLVDNLLNLGTTIVLYFGTIHKEANLKLAEICAKKGQRALVGKIVIDDQEQNPDYYRDQSSEIAIKETEEFILIVKELDKNVSKEFIQL